MGAIVSCIESVFQAIGGVLMAIVNGIAAIIKAIINGIVAVFDIIVGCLTCRGGRRRHAGGGSAV